MSLKHFQAATAEFFGTFFLCFTIAGSGNTFHFTPTAAPFGIGMGLVALIYMTGSISGGMLNPAVTTGLVIRGKKSLIDAGFCIPAQILGALLAGFLVYALEGIALKPIY